MPSGLIRHLLSNLEKPIIDPNDLPNVRNLNHYIEAQVHGDVEMRNDVDALVADPSFKHTPTGERFANMAESFGIDVYWHQGFQLSVDSVPNDFRGPDMVSLAERIAKNGFVDVSLIGEAAMDLKSDPSRWSDRGEYKKVLQELKLLWHVLVKYGQPFASSFR